MVSVSYDKGYFNKTYGHILKDPGLYEVYSRLNKKKLFKGIDIKNKKILEYGCGSGKNIYDLEGAIGFDISGFALESCHKLGIKVTNNPKKNYYDIILCSHVLEHTDNPLLTLKKLKSYLKKEGILILMIPEETNILIKKYRVSVDNHLYNWTFQNLTNLLLKSGFNIKSCDWPEQGMFYKILKKFYLSNFELTFNLASMVRKILFIKKEEFRIVAVNR